MLTYETSYKDKMITLAAIPMGKDFAVAVSGGDHPHIEAVAVCVPGEHASIITIPNHREGTLAIDLATIICSTLGCSVTVAVGIHYEKLTKSERDEVVEVAGSLMDRFLKDCR